MATDPLAPARPLGSWVFEGTRGDAATQLRGVAVTPDAARSLAAVAWRGGHADFTTRTATFCRGIRFGGSVVDATWRLHCAHGRGTTRGEWTVLLLGTRESA